MANAFCVGSRFMAVPFVTVWKNGKPLETFQCSDHLTAMQRSRKLGCVFTPMDYWHARRSFRWRINCKRLGRLAREKLYGTHRKLRTLQHC